ncbi:hypothetical protein QZH41_004334 [Actinostola sp. cb2023]|nr:hypothetical protein QZH41_004334 [Actinostola sp. cb2023]
MAQNKSKRRSIFIPEDEESDENEETSTYNDEPRRQLNRFLQLRSISPIRHSLSVPWDTAHERTKRRYTRKAEQCISAVLDVLVPEDSISLWKELCERNVTVEDGQGAPPKSGKELELLEAFTESYASAQHWSTRRQILSMMADKLSFKELQEYIPSLTSYRYNIARRHRLLHGLDNFSAQGSDAFGALDNLVNKLADCGKSQTWARDIKQHLRSSQQYLKGDYKLHAVESSTISDHCRTYALRDPNDIDFQGYCDHLHHDSCAQCSQFQDVLNVLENECANARCAEEDKADMVHVFQQARIAIMTWKAHLLRSVHQDEAKHSVLDKLDCRSVLLVQDWAMKYMPRKFREAQSDWFAKRGLPWHITVAIRRSEDNKHFEAKTIVHVFQSCSQDSATVSGIMLDCLVSLKRDMPELERAYYKQDNAGCYHSGNTILSAKLAGDAAGITVSRNDFSDPQGGKGVCDRQAATIKGAIGSTLSVKWDGISLLNNFEYEEHGIRVWRAFNVGPGRLVPWANFQVSTTQLGNLEILQPPSSTLVTGHTFRTVRHRHAKEASLKPSEEDEVCTESSEEEDEGEGMLFTCPEEGCIKAYNTFTSLQNHLDTGKHKRVPEQETLYDKAKKVYAHKLTEGRSRVPDVQCRSQGRSEDLMVLPMGWALKSIKKKTRFIPKQTNFITEQFQMGEQSGRKADPQEVSKAMALARDRNGARRFLPDEVLTPQQITSFFSRLSAKKRQGHPINIVSGDDE